MDRPATSISKSNKYHHVKTERPKSVASISYLKSDVKAFSEPSWRSRVKSVELPGKSKKTTFKPKPAANSMEGFNLDKYVENHPRDDPRICINGKPSDSPHSKTVLRTLSRYRETGSKDQPPQSDEEELLDEVFDLELLSFNAGLHPLGAPKTPLCWEDVTLDSNKYNTDAISTAQVEGPEGPKQIVTPSDSCQLSSSGCRPLSPLTSSVSIQCDNNPIEGCVLHAHATSLLTLDISLTWQDMCLLPWKSSQITKHAKTPTNTDFENRIRNGLCVDGLATASEEGSQGQKRVEMLLKCMLLSTASSSNKGKGDLMCIWLRLPSQGPSNMHSFRLELCVFDVYLSESSGQISTRILKKQSPVKVANNLFLLKFNLLSCLPWMCDAGSISGRNLEILIYLVQPDRYSGCIFQKSLHLSVDTPTSSDESPSQASTSVPTKPDIDRDKMTLIVNDTEIDPSNGDAQDLIISLYDNPYQLHKDKVSSPPSANRSQTYTDIVHFHLDEFISNGRTSTHHGIIEPRQSSARPQKQQGRQVCLRPLSTAKKTKTSGIVSIPSRVTQTNHHTQRDNIVSKYYGQSVSLATSSS